jgi:hypothetical protein
MTRATLPSHLIAMMICVLTLATSCSTTEIKTASDPQSNVAQYKTFAWAPADPSKPVPAATTMLDQTVQATLQHQLEAKGLKLVSDPKQAQLWISYQARGHNQVSYGVAPSPWDMGISEEPVVTKVGSLTLRFLDPKAKRTVWQGTASDVIDVGGASQEQISQAVVDLMKKYPV